MAEQVRIDITADDQASQKIDKVAGKVDDLESAKVEIPVGANTDQAGRDIQGLMSKVDGLARDPANILLSTNAVQIGTQILDLVDQLGRLDAADPDVQIKVDQINSLQGDLDTVESKLRDINDVEVSPKVDTSSARKEIEDIPKSAESARSVTANAIGNLSQDVGALGGIAGSAGVAFGQMGEYMTEAAASGEGLGSVLANFGKQGALIAGVTLAVSLFTSEIEKSRKAAEEDKAQTNDLFKALQQGGTIIDAFRKQIEDTGQFKFAGLGDILPQLNAVNLSVNEFARLAALPEPQLKAWEEAQRKLVTEGTPAYDAMRTVVFALEDAHANAADATARHESTVKALGDSTERYTAMVADQETKLAASQAATAAYQRTQQDTADTLDRVNQKLTEEADALGKQADAAVGAADAQLQENRSLEEYNSKLHDAKASTNDVTDAAISLAKAHQATAEAQAEANGQTLTATQKLDSLNDGLLSTAATAKGPAKQGIIDYIGSVNQIPPEKMTEIQAAINAGDLDTAKRLLNEASAPRQTAIHADADTAAANRDIDYAARDRQVMITAKLNPNYGAALGPILTQGGPRSMPSEAGGGEVVNVTQYLPRGWRGDALGEARRAARRTGGLYARTRR